MRFLFIALAALLGLTVPLAAQKQKSTTTLMAQADSAVAAGDHTCAQRLYAKVLRAEPDNSRATYQLARLEPAGSRFAIKLFRRYVELEPQDPWGYMALGEAFAKAGYINSAVRWHVEAVTRAPLEQDFWISLGKVLERAGQVDASVRVYERWAAVRPKEALAWNTLGGASQRAGRLREAASAYERALTVQPNEATMKRLRQVLAEAAPAFTPLAGRSWDSDGNVVLQGGLMGNWMAFDRTRLGVKVSVTEAEDSHRRATANEFALTASLQPRSNLYLDGRAGLVQTRGSRNLAYSPRTTPELYLRTRWRAPANGPAAELGLTLAPLTATPLLLAQPVVLKELQWNLRAPVYGPLRLRGLGQLGTLKSARENNRRLGYGGALALRLLPDWELSAQYRAVDYTRPTKSGYFAPDLLQTIEVGSYLSYSRLWPLTLTLDLGGGAQKVTPHGRAPYSWGRVFRLWALVSWNIQPGRELAVEFEKYDSVIPGNALVPAYGWRYGALTFSLRWGFGASVNENVLDTQKTLEAAR
jgi:Flp pilus assembly protein TadD